MNLLTPTANRRFNELVGLVWIALALMVLLSLISFSPADRTLHTSSDAVVTVNWVGTVGANSADLLFQLLGACAFLLSIVLGWIGIRWFRSRPAVENWGKGGGAILLFL